MVDYEAQLREILQRMDQWFLEGEIDPFAQMGANLYPYDRLFEPIQVNSIRLRNRIVMGPMGNISMADEMGRPSRKMIEYFSERARGGVGLITSGLVPVSQGIEPTVTEPGDRSYFPRIDQSRTVYAGWRILAETIHAFGSHFFIQLTPGLGRVGSPEVVVKKHTLPVSASWNPNYYMPAVPCRPLTDSECWRIIKAMGQASADAQALLIDGVYIHGHEGYLLEQMTNPAYNRRMLGQFRNWKTFGLEIVREIRKRVGPAYPIMYRIDLSLGLHATYAERMNEVHSLRKFRNERTIEMTLDYLQDLVREGVDLFDVDLGSYDNWWLPHPPNSAPPGCYLEVAKIAKDFLAHQGIVSNFGLPVPIIGVGKLGYPDLAEQALRENMCDMIMLARPLLADPEWPNKAYAGRTMEIRPCIGDQEGCLNEFLEGGHLQCSVNPRTGFEEAFPRILTPASDRKRIAVVGAGPAGITCAVIAAQRGHDVELFEARDKIGGMLVPGSVPRIKYEVANYREYLVNQISDASNNYSLKLFLNRMVDARQLKDGHYDTVIFCSGGKPLIPTIPGIDSKIVFQAVDIFLNPDLLDGSQNIVVVGGGSVGCECAHFLAWEKGKNVTIIEMLPAFMRGVCTANRTHLIRTLEQKRVKLLNCTQLTQIEQDGIRVNRNHARNVPNPYITWAPLLPENVQNPLARPIGKEYVEEKIDADAIILALGIKPDTRLYDLCNQEKIAPEMYQIGDAFQTGRVFEAVKAGFAIGNSL